MGKGRVMLQMRRTLPFRPKAWVAVRPPAAQAEGLAHTSPGHTPWVHGLKKIF